MNDWLVNMRNGVAYLTEPKSGFEELYLEVREKESRVYSDELVRQLPDVPKGHIHFKEWQKRRWTLHRFIPYLQRRKNCAILEIGCGNGWLTQQMAPYADSVYGLDVGQHELEQAARCSTHPNASYICCDDWRLLPEASFDTIVFAGSFQYFESTTEFWDQLFRCLKINGEIHILDTPFYASLETGNAKKRSENYFSQLGSSQASTYYHHHSWSDLPKNVRVKYTPNKLSLLFRKRSPFPWLIIYPEQNT